jgi:flavin reductase (DIM6/NTAB) family NADH-FMN oxidoreductase RutF
MAQTAQGSATDEVIRDLSKAVFWLPQPAMIITAAAGERRNLMFAVRGMHYLDPPNSSLTIGVARHSVTGQLIEESGEFGVNVVAGDQAILLQKGRELVKVPSDQSDKFALYGVETFQGDVIAAPLIVGSACSFECKVIERYDVGEKYYMVVGDVVALHGFPARPPMVMFRQAGYSLETVIPGTSR